MKLTRRDRRAVMLCAAALVAILAGRLIVIPWIDSWGDARRRIADAHRQLVELESRLRRVVAQRRRLEGQYGPRAADPPADVETARIQLLEAAQDVLTANGLKATYSPQPTRVVKSVPGIELVALQVRGQFKLGQLTKCLAGMRAAPTLVMVDCLSISNDAKKPGNLDVTLTLTTLAEQQGAHP